MSGNTKEIYCVSGTQFQTIEVLRAINRAKELAIKTKAQVVINKNGTPFRLVNYKGQLIPSI